jgi:hypothetical protein
MVSCVRGRSESQWTLELRGDLGHGPPAAVTVGAGGHLLVATTSADPKLPTEGRPFDRDWAAYLPCCPDRPYDVTVRVLGSEGIQWHVPDLPLDYPNFQPLPEGRLLAVGPRARWTGHSGEHNAVIIDADGTLMRSFCIGDGVRDVQVSPTGTIWVGYGDEGVFGNLGWGSPRGPMPLGRPGLVSWSEAGTKVWEYESPGGLEGIADCYALNVVGETVWTYYYAAFPIVRIDGGIVTHWPSGIEGAGAIVALDPFVALVGRYRDPTQVLVVNLDDGSGETFRLRLPGDTPLPERTHVMARGSEVHAIDNGRWYSADLANLVRIDAPTST